MGRKPNTEVKERILNTAITLIAERGYNAVGVREIAKNADVSISMISYYFNGKMGILKEILNMFFDKYLQMLEDTVDNELTPNDNLQNLFVNISKLISENHDICKIVFLAIPHDNQELQEFKLEKIPCLINPSLKLYQSLGFDIEDKVRFSIVGPTISHMLFSHFFNKPIMKEVLGYDVDLSTKNIYTETMVDLFLDGMNGVIKKQRAEKKQDLKEELKVNEELWQGKTALQVEKAKESIV